MIIRAALGKITIETVEPSERMSPNNEAADIFESATLAAGVRAVTLRGIVHCRPLLVR